MDTSNHSSLGMGRGVLVREASPDVRLSTEPLEAACSSLEKTGEGSNDESDESCRRVDDDPVISPVPFLLFKFQRRQ
jgi:hypothetical protein